MISKKAVQRQLALREKAIRELERRHQKESDNLVSFIEYYFKEELNKPFFANWHHKVIAEALQKTLTGEITRLIINIPPGSGKTEMVTKSFPVWTFGKIPEAQFIVTGYSAKLTQSFGSQARDYYRSDAFKKVFPRRPEIRDDQDTKGLWKNTKGGQYLATGTAGSITGNRANWFIIDDPIKPDEADRSDVKREAVNQWYDNTVLSRLFNADKDVVIIVMQRTHENDLCGHLLEKMEDGTGENWDVISIPAIATEDDGFREYGDSYHEERVPLTALEKIRGNNPVAFSTQYQQDPVDKESQEFHEEFFKYYEELPKHADRLMQIFTVIDPAFKQKQHNDESAIITGGFLQDELYILEITHGRFVASDLIDKIVYHARKWKPRKIGIEGYAAQTVLAQFLKKALTENKLFVPVDEIIQKGDKESKIRELQGPIRYGKILWRKEMTALEDQFRKFPRGKHDDIIDTLQMLYTQYLVPPKGTTYTPEFQIKYDHMGRPIYG